VTVSGFASTVTSPPAERVERRGERSGSVKVGVPPPTNTVSSGREAPALALELREKRVNVARMLLAAPTAVTKSQ
jgi:hypothetical protein